MVKIFVSGATGYIGGSVVERLVRDGHAVTGLVRNVEEARAAGHRARLVSEYPSVLIDGG